MMNDTHAFDCLRRYQHLVIETHKVEYTKTINLSEEEIQSKYDGQLSDSMTKPLSTLIATIFKALTNKKVELILRRISMDHFNVHVRASVQYVFTFMYCRGYVHTYIHTYIHKHCYPNMYG